jgi:L-histidine N-alpha-methyltransferase
MTIAGSPPTPQAGVAGAEERITILRPSGALDPLADLPQDTLRGLLSTPKWLPPKYFYDEVGSHLFERITELPEYYQTRAERSILKRVAPDLIDSIRPTALVEFGSGSASKTRVLLDEMARRGSRQGFGAIEVSESALIASAHGLVAAYPSLDFVGVLADFHKPVDLPFSDGPRLILFLGSTIGNLAGDEAVEFLGRVGGSMTEGDGFLIGFDLVKERALLDAAYNDAEGVTAEFNLNVLRVINRELGADFDLAAFEHRAFYDAAASRVEMHLVAKRPQKVYATALGTAFHFEEGETIRTEWSHKYTEASAEALLRDAGLELARWETDPGDRFAVALARRQGGRDERHG